MPELLTALLLVMLLISGFAVFRFEVVEATSGKVFEPSPEEFNRKKREIQKGWSEAERLKRAGIDPKPKGWMPPTIVSPLGVEKEVEDV